MASRLKTRIDRNKCIYIEENGSYIPVKNIANNRHPEMIMKTQKTCVEKKDGKTYLKNFYFGWAISLYVTKSGDGYVYNKPTKVSRRMVHTNEYGHYVVFKGCDCYIEDENI